MYLTALAALLSVPAAIVASIAPWAVRRSRMVRLENVDRLLASKTGSKDYREAILALQARLAEDALVAQITPWRWSRIFLITYMLLAGFYLLLSPGFYLDEDSAVMTAMPSLDSLAVVSLFSGIFFILVGASWVSKEVGHRRLRERTARRVWQGRRRRLWTVASVSEIVRQTEELVRPKDKVASTARREKPKNRRGSRWVDSNHRPAG